MHACAHTHSLTTLVGTCTSHSAHTQQLLTVASPHPAVGPVHTAVVKLASAGGLCLLYQGYPRAQLEALNYSLFLWGNQRQVDKGLTVRNVLKHVGSRLP